MSAKYLNNLKLGTSYLSVIDNADPIAFNSFQRKLISTHDINHPLTTKQFHWFNNQSINIMLGYQRGKAKAIKKLMELHKYLNLRFTYNTSLGKVHFYNVLVTSDIHNYHVIGNSYLNYLIHDINGCNAITQLHFAHKSLIKQIQSISDIKVLDTTLATKFNSQSIVFPHAHSLLMSDKTLNTAQLSTYYEQYLYNYLNYPVSVHIKPLVNKSLQIPVIIDRNNYNSDIDKSIFYKSSNSDDTLNPYYPIGFTLIYFNKTYKLAFASGGKGKYYDTDKDINTWNHTQQTKYIYSVLNSYHYPSYDPKYQRYQHNHIVDTVPYAIHEVDSPIIWKPTTTHQFYRLNQGSNQIIKSIYKQLTIQLAYLHFKLALYGVSEQLVMIDLTTIPKHSEVHSNLYKSSKTNKYVLKNWDALIQNQDKHITNQILKYINQINIYSNCKELPDRPLHARENGYPVPLIILLRVILSNSLEIMQKNKELHWFDSS